MGENLPDRWIDLPAPTQPSDLDGWTTEDMSGWLPSAAERLAEVEARTEEMRAAVGLVLWRILSEGGERVYGETADMVARAAGVTVATLTRWRTAAEKQFQLAAPSKRTTSQRDREKSGSLTRRTRKLSAGRGDTQAPEVQPAATQGRGTSPRADGTASPRGAQPPDPPAAPLPKPTTKEDYRRLIGLVVTTGADVFAHSVERSALIAANKEIVAAVGMIDGSANKEQAPKKAEPVRTSAQPEVTMIPKKEKK